MLSLDFLGILGCDQSLTKFQPGLFGESQVFSYEKI